MSRCSERFRLGVAARLWVDARGAQVVALGRVVDLSLEGCRLLIRRRIGANVPGRVGIDVVGSSGWIPVVARWAQRTPDGWMVGCEFDQPSEEKQEIVRELLGRLMPIDGA